jgi:phenylalanine-specific permease
MFVLVGMAELTAAGIYMQYWFPDVPTWIWAAAFFIIINAVNLVNVRLYGETEFWFALIKVLAIIGMIGFGLWMLFGGHGGESQLRQSLVSRRFLRHRLERPDPLPCGDYVFLRRPELIGITAAEASEPHTIPESGQPGGLSHPAVLYRFSGGSAGAVSVGRYQSRQQPFVMIFHNLNSNLVASALNFVILVASLSVYNSGVYSNSRMLFGLSVQGTRPPS